MGVVGFNFTKIDAERKNARPKGGVEVNHSLGFDNIEKGSLELAGSKSDVLRITFHMDVLYAGGAMGKIGLVGDLVYTDTKEIVEETLKQWEKNKEISPQIKESLYRFVHNKGIYKAFELSEAINLPSPLPLPKYKVESKK